MRQIWRQNLTPILARTLSSLGATTDLRAGAVRTRMLAPGDETDVPAALHLEGEVERIRGTDPDTVLEVELERLRARRVRHAATLAHVLRDVTWSSGHACGRRTHHRATDARLRLWSREAVASLDRAVVASTQYGSRYFGHWLTDDVPLAMTASPLAPPIVPNRKWTPHQRQYLTLFGLSPRSVEEAWVRELTILDDVGANASKRERWQHMRARVRRLGGPAAERPGVMFLRGSTGNIRRLTNEMEIAEHFAARGFEIVEAETLTVHELARRAAGARVVLGVEGSQVLHGLFAMADGGAVVTLQPPDRFLTSIKIYCDALGLRFAMVIGDGSTTKFHIDVDRVARTVDLALAARGRGG